MQKVQDTPVVEQARKTPGADNVQERWFRPVNRWGRLTTIVAMAASFIPFLYLYVMYRDMPSVATVIAAMGAVSATYIVPWIVEPISYFPALGTAGTYMGMLAGSMAQMRVPASLVAKRVAGVEENTQEAEIVGTCGIAGSVYMNLLILLCTAVFGSAIIPQLPEAVLAAMTAYVLPAIFGALLAMFTTKGKLPITIPVVIIAVVAGLLVRSYMPTLNPGFMILGCVVLGVLIARVEYKLGIAK